MLAGFSKADVTPPLRDMEVFGLGYWFERAVEFKGVRDPLLVRAVALDEGACQLIVSVDAIFDSFGFIPEAVRRITSVLPIGSESVFITCTHTHSTPVINRNGADRGAEYGAYVAERIVDCALDAYRNREPVTIGLSKEKVPDALYNRRPLLRNGRVAELHVPLDPDTLADSGPIDETLTVVKYRRSNGDLLGALCHFGIHGVAVQCSDLISSDCMGRAIQRVEAERHGLVMLHLNGPCGDIDPVEMGSAAALDAVSGKLHAGIERAITGEEHALLSSPQTAKAGTFRARRRDTRSAVALHEEELRLKHAAQAGGGLAHHSGPGYQLFLIREEKAVAAMPSQFDIHYQILRLGDLVLTGIGGEVFTSSGLHLKSLGKEVSVLPVGITGSSHGYLPPERAFAEGGYEVACARWCPIAPGETEKLVSRVEEDLSSVIGAENQ